MSAHVYEVPRTELGMCMCMHILYVHMNMHKHMYKYMYVGMHEIPRTELWPGCLYTGYTSIYTMLYKLVVFKLAFIYIYMYTHMYAQRTHKDMYVDIQAHLYSCSVNL
jgi:hypothetical protein